MKVTILIGALAILTSLQASAIPRNPVQAQREGATVLKVTGNSTTIDGKTYDPSDVVGIMNYPFLENDAATLVDVKSAAQTQDQKIDLYDQRNVLVGEIDMSVNPPRFLQAVQTAMMPEAMTYSGIQTNADQTQTATLQFDFSECYPNDYSQPAPPQTPVQQCRSMTVVLALQVVDASQIVPRNPSNPRPLVYLAQDIPAPAPVPIPMPIPAPAPAPLPPPTVPQPGQPVPGPTQPLPGQPAPAPVPVPGPVQPAPVPAP